MIEELKKAILEETRYEFSIHAVDQSILRKITRQQMHEAIETEVVPDLVEN